MAVTKSTLVNLHAKPIDVFMTPCKISNYFPKYKHLNPYVETKMFPKKSEFALFVLLSSSLFLASQCHHQRRHHQSRPLIELQRCQIECLMDDDNHGSRYQKLCLMKCHEGYAEETDQSFGSLHPQIEDPQKQYERCRSGCERYRGERQMEAKQLCRERCKEQYEEELKRQQEQTEERSPEKIYKQCLSSCSRRKVSEEMEKCKKDCVEEYKRVRKGQEGNQEHGEKNPYFFHGQSFKSTVKTEAGEFKVLERFSKLSELLTGIDHFRLAIYEADPNTFIVPHHCDADLVSFVSRGEGIVTFVDQQRKESFDLKRGDVFKIPAGATAYFINSHNIEKLRIFMLLHPINTPGQFKGFFGAGGKDKETFYRVFSNEILEAALNVTRDKVYRVLGQKETIVRASQEQIKELSQHRHQSGSSKHHGKKSRGPFNLLRQKPFFSNNYGQFFLASPEEFKQLKDLDVSVSLMNITEGAMAAPYFNSRSTIIVLVDEGRGYFEMACPSQTQPGSGEQEQDQEQEQRISRHYEKARAQVSVGDVFIIPADHPISIVSTGNQNLQLVGYGINAENNHKNFLAGKDNIWNNFESLAKELSFGAPSSEVDEVFRSQEQAFFLSGPGRQQQQQQQQLWIPMPSIMDFVGFV